MMLLELVTLIVVLAILGFCVWLVVTYVPMPDPFRKAIIVIVVLVLLLWIVRALVTGGALLPGVR
jgi:hypothetical protein